MTAFGSIRKNEKRKHVLEICGLQKIVLGEPADLVLVFI